MINSSIGPMDFLVAHAKMDAEKKASQWTTDAPIEPGWYWVLSRGSASMVYLWKKNGRSMWVDTDPTFKIESSRMALRYALRMKYLGYTHWLGPLPEPEPPPT